MKIPVVFATLGVAAVILGLLLALPLFNWNLNHPVDRFPGGRAYITVDPIYAYFKINPFNQDTAGLWRSNSNLSQTKESLVSYLLIMNITSHSNATVYMDRYDVYAAEYIRTNNTRTEISQTITSQFIGLSRITDGPDDRLQKVYPSATRWEPNQSQLVTFSGVIEVNDITALQNGTFYIGCRVNGTPIDGVPSYGAGSKQITMTKVGSNEFLYNNLLGPNQVLGFAFEGHIAYVDAG
jgi:hypothetical protein